MSSIEMLELLAFSVSIILLGYSAYSDLKRREVSDKVWIIYAPLATGFTLTRLILNPQLLTTILISISITFILSFSIFYLGLFGGADAKALLCLGAALPIYPFNINPPLGIPHPFYPLATFYNAYLFSIFIVLYAISKNAIYASRSRGNLFAGLDDEPLHRKAIAILTGYKVDIGTLKNKLYLYPIEKAIHEGEKRRKLTLYVDIETDRDDQVKNLINAYSDKDTGMVWATPGLPLLFFILISLISNIFIGDILVWIAFNIASSLIT